MSIDALNQYIYDQIPSYDRAVVEEADQKAVDASAKKQKQYASELEIQRSKDEKQQAKAVDALVSAVKQQANTVGAVVTQTSTKIQSLPTPGGLLFLVFVLFALVFLVIPVNEQGQTRGELLFNMFLGKAQLKDRVQFQGGGFSSGDFGGKQPITPQPAPNTSNGTSLVSYRGL